MVLRVAIVVLVGLIALTSPGPAWGAGPAVAVVEFRSEGEIAPAARAQMMAGLYAGLAGSLSPLSSDEVAAIAQATNPGLVGCQELACKKELGRLTGMRVLIEASALSEMELYHFGFVAVDATTGEVLSASTGACEICTLVEASQSIRTVAERFAAEVAPIASALAGVPLPEPLVVQAPPAPTPPPPIEATPVEPTPVLALPSPPATSPGVAEAPPPDALALAQPTEAPAEPMGDAPIAPTVEEPAEATALPNLSTAGLPPPPDPEPALPAPQVAPDLGPAGAFPYSTVALGALGGGLALLGAGGALFARDGDATCDDKPLQRCPTVYDTGSAGLAAVVVGGVSLLASVVLFVLDQAASGADPRTPPELPTLPAMPGTLLHRTW